MKFSINCEIEYRHYGVRVRASKGLIFVPGFVCQLFVKLLGTLNVSLTILLLIILKVVRLLRDLFGKYFTDWTERTCC